MPTLHVTSFRAVRYPPPADARQRPALAVTSPPRCAPSTRLYHTSGDGDTRNARLDPPPPPGDPSLTLMLTNRASGPVGRNASASDRVESISA